MAYLNMSDPSQQCPSVWQEITTPHRVCGRNTTSICQGLSYSTGSEQYDQVCGRITGYQIGGPNHIGSTTSLDGAYINGVIVTRGSPRQHIWSFVNGLNEVPGANTHNCPCVAESTMEQYIPSFVEQNYFCETGVTRWTAYSVFWLDGDPLWDGQGCGPTSTCCSFHSPPWFSAQLSSPTTDFIEVRICNRLPSSHADTPIQLIELYIK